MNFKEAFEKALTDAMQKPWSGREVDIPGYLRDLVIDVWRAMEAQGFKLAEKELDPEILETIENGSQMGGIRLVIRGIHEGLYEASPTIDQRLEG